jgi:hypothetical protein
VSKLLQRLRRLSCLGHEVRYIQKRWSSSAWTTRQLELALDEAARQTFSRREGVAISLAVAGGVSLLAAIAIHRHLFLVVAPIGVGLIGCSAVMREQAKRRQGMKGHLAHSRLQFDEKTNHVSTGAMMVQGRLELPE